MSVRSATGELAGDLGLLSLFDLCQALGMNRATGTLRLESPRGKGYIHFEDGRIINGVDERSREGEKAVRGLFAWKEAHFQFQVGPISASKVIQESTQSFLLDIAREQDESAATGDKPEDSQVEKLRAHEALKAAFARIATETRQGGLDTKAAASAQLLDHLAAAAGSELLLRPAQAVLARQAAGWAPLGTQILDADEFDELLRLLSPPGQVLSSGQSALPRSPSGAPFRVMFGEDVSGPFLFVRALHAEAPSPDAAVVLPPGLDWETLLSGPRVEVTGGRGAGKSLFLAAAARAACERGLTVAWGSPEPAARLFNLDLPLQYLPGGLLNPDLFLELAIGLRANVLVWDGPPAALPGLLRLPEWGTAVLAAGTGLTPPSQVLRVTLGADGRVRVLAAGA